MYGHSLKSPTRGSPLAAALMHSRASAEAGAGHQTLLVPLDGSYTAESALVHVVKAAQSSKIKVLLLNVQAPAHPDELGSVSIS